MKRIALVPGVVLTLAGAYLLWAGGISWTEEEQVLDVGPVRATAETRERMDVGPLVAGLVMAVGVGGMVWGVTGRHG